MRRGKKGRTAPLDPEEVSALQDAGDAKGSNQIRREIRNRRPDVRVSVVNLSRTEIEKMQAEAWECQKRGIVSKTIYRDKGQWFGRVLRLEEEVYPLGPDVASSGSEPEKGC